jgi:hypothetical protein
MSEPGGVLALRDSGADDELMYDLALGAESDADLAKKYGYKSVQSIWNKRSRNKERIQQIRDSRRRQLEAVHAEKFEDLRIMRPLARMAGFNEAWHVALRKMIEIDARSYNPVTGESRPQSMADAQQFKLYYGIFERASRAAVELSGELPGRVPSIDHRGIRLQHRDPKPKEEEPEARNLPSSVTDSDDDLPSEWRQRWDQIQAMRSSLGPFSPRVFEAIDGFEADFAAVGEAGESGGDDDVEDNLEDDDVKLGELSDLVIDADPDIDIENDL